jgi:hypothetical protein
MKDFSISRYEVTESQWFAVMGKYPSGGEFGNCETCPIRMVSWNDIQLFIENLNRLTGKNYRLPTESEWEFAAKGGNSGQFKYAGSNDVGMVGWYDKNANHKVHPVGEKSANELGLYDMTGVLILITKKRIIQLLRRRKAAINNMFFEGAVGRMNLIFVPRPFVPAANPITEMTILVFG